MGFDIKGVTQVSGRTNGSEASKTEASDKKSTLQQKKLHSDKQLNTSVPKNRQNTLPREIAKIQGDKADINNLISKSTDAYQNRHLNTSQENIDRYQRQRNASESDGTQENEKNLGNRGYERNSKNDSNSSIKSGYIPDGDSSSGSSESTDSSGAIIITTDPDSWLDTNIQVDRLIHVQGEIPVDFDDTDGASSVSSDSSGAIVITTDPDSWRNTTIQVDQLIHVQGEIPEHIRNQVDSGTEVDDEADSESDDGSLVEVAIPHPDQDQIDQAIEDGVDFVEIPRGPADDPVIRGGGDKDDFDGMTRSEYIKEVTRRRTDT